MTLTRCTLRLLSLPLLSLPMGAQTNPPRKRLLVIGEEKGYRHDAAVQ